MAKAGSHNVTKCHSSRQAKRRAQACEGARVRGAKGRGCERASKTLYTGGRMLEIRLETATNGHCSGLPTRIAGTAFAPQTVYFQPVMRRHTSSRRTPRSCGRGSPETAISMASDVHYLGLVPIAYQVTARLADPAPTGRWYNDRRSGRLRSGSMGRRPMSGAPIPSTLKDDPQAYKPDAQASESVAAEGMHSLARRARKGFIRSPRADRALGASRPAHQIANAH
jgi:hypothetical protein